MTSWNASLPADSSKIRLSAGFIRQNWAALQAVLTSGNLTNGYPYIPTAVPMYMYADVAPNGWTIYNTVADCLLSVKGGSSQYNTTGGTGTAAGTWNGPAYALIANQLPNLSVSQRVWSGNDGTTAFMGAAAIGSSGNVTITVNSGGGMTHEHDWTTTRPFAAVGILATKNA